MSSKKQATALTCDQLYERLTLFLNPAKFAVFAEVRNAGGFSATRSADAIAMALWPSDGYRITGYEIKAHRSDWLRELKDPKKSDDMAKHCDQWMIVANVGVVDRERDMIPESWGLIEPSGTGLRTVRGGAILEGHIRGPVNRAFLSSLLKRASETALTSEQEKRIRKEAATVATASMKRDLERAKASLEGEIARRKNFERASGIEMEWHDSTELGKVVRDVLDNKYSDPVNRLRNLRTTAAAIVDDIDSRLARFHSTPGPEAVT